MTDSSDDARLGELLVSTGKLSPDQLQACFETQRLAGNASPKRLEEILVERGHLSLDEVATTIQAISDTRREPATDDASPPPAATGQNEDPLDPEVQEALADPSRRIGRYVALSELGRGGMGVVQKAYDPQLRRHVAIKTLLDSETADDGEFARFRQEAQAIAKLRHPCIVAVHEVGEHEGRPFLAMDFVEGEPLADLLKRKKISPRLVADIVRRVARALDHAHSAGITHRDVKPQNIMLDDTGRPLLMDFGLARDNSAQQHLTQTGQVLGTPLYMAPEQVAGEGVGPWTDVYALGAMLYRSLVGRPPFKAKEPAALFKQILLDEPASLRSHDPTIHPDLDTITLKCLEKEPQRRYQSAGTVADELQRFLDGEAILARPIGQGEKALRWVQRNRALTAALAAIVVLVVVATVMFTHQASQAAKARADLQKTGELEAARREERARLQAEQNAKKQQDVRLAQAEQNAKKQQDVLLAQAEQTAKKQQDVLLAQAERTAADGMAEVAAALARVRAGDRLLAPEDLKSHRRRLLKHPRFFTVRLITADLNQLTIQLTQSRSLSPLQVQFLHFLCDSLADLGIQEGTIASLGQYLEAELALPAEARDQQRPIPAGMALSSLGGEEARRLLLEAKAGFGPNSVFWQQIERTPHQMQAQLSIKPESALDYFKRGHKRGSSGDLDGAIADLTRAIDLDLNYAAAWKARGNHRYKKGDLDGAIVDFSRAIELEPAYTLAWLERGIAFYDKGAFENALADATRALEITPNYAHAMNSRGTIQEALGNLADAMADFNKAIELAPEVALYWSNRGFVHFRLKDHAAAIADLNQAILLDPNLRIAWSNRGRTRLAQAKLDQAIADFSRALELGANSSFDWQMRGDAKLEKHAWEDAKADYSRAIQIDPRLANAWFSRGWVKNKLKDFEGAIADYTHTLEVDPRHIKAMINRGALHKNIGNTDAAIADFSRAITIDPDHPKAWYNRGNIHNNLHHYGKAIADYTEALRINPKYAQAFCNRGNARKQQQDLEGAIADWQRFLELAPNHRVAPTIRSNLQKARQQQAKQGAGADK